MLTKRDCTYFLLGCLFSLLIFLIFSQYQLSQIDDKKINDCLLLLDKTVINDVGNTEIFSIVNISKASENTTERLDKIAELITEDFSCQLWDDSFKPLISTNSTWSNKKGKIYIARISDESIRRLSLSPNWLIYQKTGACRELSLLFFTITELSGFKSRVVRTGNGDSKGYGATHWWNEVEINSENKTFDVLWYGQIKNEVSGGTSWIGNRSEFQNNSNDWSPRQLCELGGVWIVDGDGKKNEDITAL